MNQIHKQRRLSLRLRLSRLAKQLILRRIIRLRQLLTDGTYKLA